MAPCPQSAPGRYAELDAGQLADVVEHAYDDLPEWELVFELSRRAMSAEGSNLGHAAIAAAREA